MTAAKFKKNRLRNNRLIKSSLSEPHCIFLEINGLKTIFVYHVSKAALIKVGKLDRQISPVNTTIRPVNFEILHYVT